MHNEIGRKEVDRMFAADIIAPVESSWTYPVFIATNKDGSSCFCVDYRKLNSGMLSFRCPLPSVDEILDDMKGSALFTTIDLFRRYWKIKMYEACEEIAAFTCRYDTLQFEVLPFGLMNSQAIFLQMKGRILLRVNNLRCYVEDVPIFS